MNIVERVDQFLLKIAKRIMAVGLFFGLSQRFLIGAWCYFSGMVDLFRRMSFNLGDIAVAVIASSTICLYAIWIVQILENSNGGVWKGGVFSSLFREPIYRFTWLLTWELLDLRDAIFGSVSFSISVDVSPSVARMLETNFHGSIFFTPLAVAISLGFLPYLIASYDTQSPDRAKDRLVFWFNRTKASLAPSQPARISS